MEILAPVWRSLQKNPKLKRKRFEVDADVAEFWRSQSKGLKDKAASDEAMYGEALGVYNESLPELDDAYRKDLGFLGETRPGGRQENRFGDMIRGAFQKARDAGQIGLDKARAGINARRAMGGGSPFGDSRYSRSQDALLQQNFETEQAAREQNALLDNARYFYANYRPGAAMGLGAQRMQYASIPLGLRGQTDALTLGRGNQVLQGLRGSYDDHYYWSKPKNWATYMEAADQSIGNVASIALSAYTGGAAGGQTTQGNGQQIPQSSNLPSYGGTPGFDTSTSLGSWGMGY